MCRFIVRIRSNNADKALHSHGGPLINVALVLLPASRHPLQVAALPQSHIPQYKFLGNHLIVTPYITSVWSHPHQDPHSPQTNQWYIAMLLFLPYPSVFWTYPALALLPQRDFAAFPSPQ